MARKRAENSDEGREDTTRVNQHTGSRWEGAKESRPPVLRRQTDFTTTDTFRGLGVLQLWVEHH